MCYILNTLFPHPCRLQVLGEYSHLKEELDPTTVPVLLAKVLAMKTPSSETKTWVLMAMTKLCDGGAGAAVAQQVSEAYSSCLDTVLRQRGHELQLLSQDPELRARVLPRGAGPEGLEVTEVNHDSNNGPEVVPLNLEKALVWERV